MASVFSLLEAFNRKEAAALGFFPCATASCFVFSKTGLESATASLVKPFLHKFGVNVVSNQPNRVDKRRGINAF